MFAVGTIIFICLNRSGLFGTYKGLFFKALITLLLSTIFISLIALIINQKFRLMRSIYTSKDIIIGALLLFFVNWNIYGLIPFNVSRSNSIIILNLAYKMGKEGYSLEEADAYAIDKYIKGYRAVKIRIDEQIRAGHLELIDGKFYITTKGRVVAEIFSCITGLYKVENNFLEDVACTNL
jgi:hypothetical protein